MTTASRGAPSPSSSRVPLRAPTRTPSVRIEGRKIRLILRTILSDQAYSRVEVIRLGAPISVPDGFSFFTSPHLQTRASSRVLTVTFTASYEPVAVLLTGVVGLSSPSVSLIGAACQSPDDCAKPFVSSLEENGAFEAIDGAVDRTVIRERAGPRNGPGSPVHGRFLGLPFCLCFSQTFPRTSRGSLSTRSARPWPSTFRRRSSGPASSSRWRSKATSSPLFFVFPFGLLVIFAFVSFSVDRKTMYSFCSELSIMPRRLPASPPTANNRQRLSRG